MIERTAKVGALEHGLQILRMYRDDDEVLSISEMARRLSVHPSTASRLAATLLDSGFLTLDGQAGRYRLGGELIRLGQLARPRINVVDVALRYLRELCKLSGETGHIGLLDRTEVITAAGADGWQTIRMHNNVGKRSPAYCSSMGKCLLSALSTEGLRALFGNQRLLPKTPQTIITIERLSEELESVRRLGYALDTDELEVGLRCVSAPIYNEHGQVVAALGLSGPASRFDRDTLLQLAVHVRDTAARTMADIGGRNPAP